MATVPPKPITATDTGKPDAAAKPPAGGDSGGDAGTLMATTALGGNGGAAPAAKVVGVSGQGINPVRASTATPAQQAQAAQQTAPQKAPFKVVGLGTASKWIKLLIYGPYGTGKTFLAATAAAVEQMGDVLLINAEKGDLTLQTEDGYDFNKIDKIDVSDWKTSARIFEFLSIHCQRRDANDIEGLRRLEAQVKEIDIKTITEPRRYRTVIIDSMTEVESFSMYNLLGINENTRLDADTASPEWSEYKKNTNAMARYIRSFRDLPIHVIMICQENYVQDEQKRQLFSPAMTGQLSKKIQGFMDMVGYYRSAVSEDGKTQRQLAIQPTGRFAAKNRFSSYKQPHFMDPTMRSILQSVGLLEPAKS